VFAFHLHALIDICKPKQLLESLQKSPLMPDMSASSLEIEFLTVPLMTVSQCLHVDVGGLFPCSLEI